MVNTGIRLIIFSAAVYIPTNGVEGSPFLHILADTWYLLVFLRVAVWTGVRWLLLVVLTCPSLMLSDAEHLYVSVGRLDIFFGKMSIQVPRLFLNWSIQWWVFFFSPLLSCMSSLCILNINPLSGVWDQEYCSHSVKEHLQRDAM